VKIAVCSVVADSLPDKYGNAMRHAATQWAETPGHDVDPQAAWSRMPPAFASRRAC
jgi:hypothetical protein